MRDTEFLKHNLVAHRGLHNIKNGIPENSMLAFKEAIKKDYIIELDVHILKDGNVVVFHDDNLERMTGINKDIKDMNLCELEKLRLLGTNQQIPLLKDVLKNINGKVPLIIELKYDTKCGMLEKEVFNLLKNYSGKYAIKSFNPFSVRYFKLNHPEVIRGLLLTNYKNNIIKRIFLPIIYNFLGKPDFISCNIDLLPSNTIKRFKNSKLVLGWTVSSKKSLDVAKKYCDNYIFENIDL